MLPEQMIGYVGICKNPVSALAEESQVIYFYQNVGRCPSEDEVKKLSNILDAKNQWRLVFKVKAQQQRSGSGPHSYRFVSSRLRQALTETLLDPGVDVDALSPPTSQGIVRSCQGTRYLLLGEQVVKIDKHPLLPHVFMLGPDAADKIFCRFDHHSQRFVLVPDEKGFAGAAGTEIDYVKAVREAQLRLKKSFTQQSQKIRYREGFRTDDFEEYRGVLLVDNDLRDNVKAILLYGLDDGELALAGRYADAAWELREGVVTAYKHINQVKQTLMLGDVDHPLLQRFHEIFAVEPESAEAEALMVTLLRNIEDTGSEISRHIGVVSGKPPKFCGLTPYDYDNVRPSIMASRSSSFPSLIKV
ncbi:MAG: hypothetical protein ACMX3H_19085 [Sodalis sp. (in: enterobacteria)]|uniref:hypothetical protein n=1 Tax=Sodalis sp. (in: enterobacteria) TaxID=1898979 RepID=UPI0039E4289B